MRDGPGGAALLPSGARREDATFAPFSSESLRRTPIFKSLAAPSRTDWRLAIGVCAVSVILFVALAPFAKEPLLPIPSFISVYQSALCYGDLLTSGVLFAQLLIQRTRALLVLGAAYFFTALMIVLHTLSFPGLFLPPGFLGTGPQTTVWLYMIWHAGFPVIVALYVFVKHDERPLASPVLALSITIAAAIALILGVALLTSAGHELLPILLRPDASYTPTMTSLIFGVWSLNLIVLLLLWFRRPFTTLDLWVLVVMTAWVCEIGLGAAFNAKRFDLGFYAGRAYGFLAATFLLVMLLFETRSIYVRLTRHFAEEGDEAERRASAAHRLVGQITAGVAHDFNNILMAVLANVEDLREDEELTPRQQELLDSVAASSLRAADLTRRLLAFSSKQRLVPEPTDLNELIKAGDKTLRETLGSHVEIDTALASDLWPAKVDRAQLRAALVNLCANARDAMPAGGRVLIETANVDLEEEYSRGNSSVVAGPYIMLAVRDVGCGIPPNQIDRVFEPFFTTKDVGKGPGLGLSMVYGFVKQSNGHIRIASEVGRGTSVRIYLPRSIESHGSRRAAKIPTSAAAS